MVADMKWSLRTWLIIVAVVIALVIVVGVVWGEGPAAGLLGLLGGGGTLSWRQKRKLEADAKAARAESDAARAEAEAAGADFRASAERAEDFVERVDRAMDDSAARDAAADAAAAASAAAAGRAVLDGGDDDDDLLIPDSATASRLRGPGGTGEA